MYLIVRTDSKKPMFYTDSWHGRDSSLPEEGGTFSGEDLRKALEKIKGWKPNRTYEAMPVSKFKAKSYVIKYANGVPYLAREIVWITDVENGRAWIEKSLALAAMRGTIRKKIADARSSIKSELKYIRSCKRDIREHKQRLKTLGKLFKEVARG